MIRRRFQPSAPNVQRRRWMKRNGLVLLAPWQCELTIASLLLSPALAGLFFWLRPRLFRSRPVGQVYNVHSSKLVMEPA